MAAQITRRHFTLFFAYNKWKNLQILGFLAHKLHKAGLDVLGALLSLYHTEPTVLSLRPVRSVLRSLRWIDRTKFLLKSKKPVRLIRRSVRSCSRRSIRSADRRNRMGSVIQALRRYYSRDISVPYSFSAVEIVRMILIRYDTIEEINVDSKAEYTA